MSGLDFFAFLTIGLMFITAIALAFLRYISKSRNHPEKLFLLLSIVSFIQMAYCLFIVGGFKGAANSFLGVSLLLGIHLNIYTDAISKKRPNPNEFGRFLFCWNNKGQVLFKNLKM
ncbi:YesK family protein [Bacillus sp. NPDC093026]|uniref:YesK family protein n=1 Tax=Bacillus sp. NPDC093026 TaxID=3363948 RepID=UPI0037F52978